MSRLYLDACSIIYLLEASSPFHRIVTEELLQHRVDPTAVLVTSRLSRLECRSKPLREKNTNLLATYEAFFAADRMLIAELTSDVIERATVLRARYGLKTPDALHLATAIIEKADSFLTGDTSLARCTEVPVKILAARTE